MTQEQLLSALKELLAESQETIATRERTTFDRLAAPYLDQMVLFGTGGLGKRTLQGLRKIGIEPLAFCDSSPDLWGKDIEGVKVWSPEDACRKFGNRASFVITIWNDKVGHPFEQVRGKLIGLASAPVVSFLPLYWKYPKTFLPFYSLDLPSSIAKGREKILEFANLINDDSTRDMLYKNIRSRILPELDKMPEAINLNVQFQNEFLKPNQNEVFVDAGAFNGDTIKQLLNSSSFKFKKVIALEPDAKNLLQLEDYVKKLPQENRQKIEIISKAIGNKNGPISFLDSGTEQSRISSLGQGVIECGKIDDIFRGKGVTYIKMDIEGAEPDAIQGAVRTLSGSSPILAISVYHHITHLWEVALNIHRINPDYMFFLRPHAQGGWDFILYAIPPHRLANPAIA